MEAVMLITTKVIHKFPPKEILDEVQDAQVVGPQLSIVYTSQSIFVLSLNGEGIIYLSITSFLVLEEERRAIECCQFDKSKVIISV